MSAGLTTKQNPTHISHEAYPDVIPISVQALTKSYSSAIVPGISLPQCDIFLFFLRAITSHMSFTDSICFPAISCGVRGCPHPVGAHVALTGIASALEEASCGGVKEGGSGEGGGGGGDGGMGVVGQRRGCGKADVPMDCVAERAQNGRGVEGYRGGGEGTLQTRTMPSSLPSRIE